MKMHRISIWAGLILGGILLASCNRPIPTSRQLAPPQPGSPQASTSLDPLSLTRTGLSAQIMATLTVAQITLEKPEATKQIATTAAPSTPETSPVPTEAEVTQASPTPSALPESPVPAAPTAAPVMTVEPMAPVAPFPYIVSVPAVYNLHRGEFPWCLARRFDIDPMQIMWINGFFNGQTFYAGQPVFLPQNPRPFPGPRALHRHPATYTVGWRDTIYTIACFFGDVDPMALAQANGLSASYRLNPGQTLIVP
jgi:hypothetical protein